MKLLKTFEDQDEARRAEQALRGAKRLASERDDTSTIYNLFGDPTWWNFLELGMYRLHELRCLLERRDTWTSHDFECHATIISLLRSVEKNFGLKIPAHWQ